MKKRVLKSRVKEVMRYPRTCFFNGVSCKAQRPICTGSFGDKSHFEDYDELTPAMVEIGIKADHKLPRMAKDWYRHAVIAYRRLKCRIP